MQINIIPVKDWDRLRNVEDDLDQGLMTCLNALVSPLAELFPKQIPWLNNS
jgi:hypothetical protein